MTTNSLTPNVLTRHGPTSPHRRMTVTLYLEPRIPLPSADALSRCPPRERAYFSREEFAKWHGASLKDVKLVERFARKNGITVGLIDRTRRIVQLITNVDQLQRAFGVQIVEVEIDGVRYCTHDHPLAFPDELKGVVRTVLGIDTRPVARPFFVVRESGADTDDTGTFTAPRVAALYNFPKSGNGAGQTIALIELGGGYIESNLATYFDQLAISPAPIIISASVDGANNNPGANSDDDSEVQLDIEIAGAVAPGALIVVYFTKNTDQCFINALSQAIHSSQNPSNIVSISWGGSESGWRNAAAMEMDQVLQEAALLGISVFAASGDGGSSDGATGTHVNFPASSPNCTACGGTSLTESDNMITGEVTWNNFNGYATGGGVSAIFPLPSFQNQAGVPPAPGTGTSGRGVPDVGGNADPNTGYQVLIDGQSQILGGTSAVAPLWAGLAALLNQSLGCPIGFLNPTLYSTILQAGGLNDITEGDNITNGSTDEWCAGPGWDPCTGLGSPNGDVFLQTYMTD